MITDACETSCQMAAAESLYGEIPVIARGAAMNYQEAYLPIVLIKTACSHGYFMQEFSPNTPARADAMAITTLIMTLQVEFDFFSI